MIDFALPPFDFPKPAIIRPAPAELLRYGGDPVAVAVEERQRRQGLVVGGPKATAKKKVLAAVATFVDSYINNSGATTYNFTANLGAGQHCVVVVNSRAVAARTISSFTADGVAGVEGGLAILNAAACGICAIYAFAATGASKTVSIQFSGSMVRCSIDVFEVENLISTTSTDDAADTSSPLTQSIDCQAGGFIIGGGHSNSTSTSWSWTNLTERSDYPLASNQRSTAASDNFADAQTGLSITATASTGAEQLMALAAYR